MSNDRGDKNSEFSTFSSFSRNTFPVPVKYLDSACNRYSQQLACDLQTTKETVVEAKCRENPHMFIVDQPQTILRICPRQNVHLSRADADTGRSNEVRVDYSFDANDSTDGRKRSRAPRVTDLRSPKDNEKPKGIEPEPGDAWGMADDSGSLPLSSTRFAKNTFTTTASETSRNGAAATDPASDIFNYSLSDFIASVTIPPPPPPSPLPPPLTPPLPLPLPPPPPQQATELFPDAVTKRGNSSSKQNSLEGLSLAAGRHRNNPTITDSLLAGQSLRDGITFTSAADHRSDDRRRSNAPVDLRRELSQSLSVPCSSSDDDFSKFVIPPPPIDVLIHDSMAKLRESKNSEEMLFSPPIANCILQLPPPVLTPPRTPAPLSISRLPPLHPPSKSRLAAGRSPSLSPRATSASSAVSRPPSSSSQSPSVFETFAFGLDSVPSPEPEQRTVEGKTKQSESTDLNRSSVQRSNIMADSTVASRENSKNTVDDSEASPSTHSGGRSNAKVTPPAPPPRRLNSSVNSSPVVKRSERRVSFGLCPTSTRYFPLDGDVDSCYHHQGQGNERAEIGSSFAKRMDFSTDSMEDLRRRPVSTTAQIRPNALRTSGSLEFHGVLLEDAAFATDDFSRMARTGCSSSYKASASVFAAIRSRLKTYWSPSMPRRRTSLRENDQSNRPSSAGWSSTTSFDFEQESSGGGDDPKGRGNSRLAGDPNKNRFSLIIDSTLDAEHDNDIELYPEKNQSTPNTFNSFTGQ